MDNIVIGDKQEFENIECKLLYIKKYKVNTTTGLFEIVEPLCPCGGELTTDEYDGVEELCHDCN